MAQWGKTREFKGDDYTIRVQPDVLTGGVFNPIGKGARISDLFLMDIQGNEVAARERFATLRELYRDTLYVVWDTQ